MIFDGWIVVVLLVWAVVAAVKLRGARRSCVVSGLVLWIIATLLWLPSLLGWLMVPLAGPLGPEWVWQLPTLPWLAGAVLVAAGVLLPVRPAAQSRPGTAAQPSPTSSGIPPPEGDPI